MFDRDLGISSNRNGFYLSNSEDRAVVSKQHKKRRDTTKQIAAFASRGKLFGGQEDL